MKKWTGIIPILLIVLATGTVLAEVDGWINNAVTLKVNEKFSLKATQEQRHAKPSYAGVPYLKNIQAGIVYKLPSSFYVAVLYKLENEDKGTFVGQENRITYESGWKTKLGKSLTFDTRVKLESRFYDQKSLEDHIRYRLRVRFTANTRVGQLKINPFIATEPFGDNKDASTDVFFRNRFYAGFAFPVGDKIKLIANYIRQDTKDKDTLHILNTGIEVSL